jgi:hypothetical protein
MQEDWPQQPQKQGMSTAAKVLLILGIVGGICALLCCGGAFFFFWKAKDALQNAVTMAPEAVRERTAQIVKIDVPPGFEPFQALDMVFMRWVLYTKGQNQEGVLMLMEFGNQMMGNQQQQRQQMRDALRQQQRGGGMGELQAQETESREYTVKGEKVSFEFVKGTNRQGQAMREVTGSFPTRNGVAMLMLLVPEDDYDEAAVVKMIESISEPEQPGELPAERALPEDAQAPADDPGTEVKP